MARFAKGAKNAEEKPEVVEGREEIKKIQAALKKGRDIKKARKAAAEEEEREVVKSVRDSRNVMVKAAKEGHLMAPPKREEPSFATEEVKEVEKKVRKPRAKKVKEAPNPNQAILDLYDQTPKDDGKVKVRMMTKKEIAADDKKIAELQAILSKKYPDSKPVEMKKEEKKEDIDAEAKKAATKEKRLAALVKAREAKKAKREAAKPKAEEKKEEKAVVVDEKPTAKKQTIADIRKEVEELRKKFCPEIAKMRRPELVHELKRLLVKDGTDPEDKGVDDKPIAELRELLKLAREKHCPPVSKLRKPKLLEELKKLKERMSEVEKSDYSQTSKEHKDARKKEAIAAKKKRIADRVQAKKMEKEGTMKELGGRD